MLSERQQTLKGAIAWSVDLLTADERTLFARLSVLMGGFTIDAAERVASDPGKPGMVGDLDILSAIEGLADKSLVRLDVGTATEPRFRMLETIRDHASAMAREAGIEGVLRDRHLERITDLFTSTQEASRRAGGRTDDLGPSARRTGKPPASPSVGICSASGWQTGHARATTLYFLQGLLAPPP